MQLGHLRHRVGLAQEVQLPTHALRELVEQLAGAQALAQLGVALREVGEERQRGQVALHDRFDAGSLGLDHHRLSRVQPGAIGLADRSRGHRLPLELCEDGLD